MKTPNITILSGSYIRKLDEAIQKKHAALKELARINGKHFAQRNLPAAVGDHLLQFIGELKSGYEELVAYIYQYLMPSTHFPEAQMDGAVAKEKDLQLKGEIKKLEDQIINDKRDLGNYQPGSIPLRIWIVGIVTFIISIGETMFLTKSFQVTGENMLFSFVLSISVSVTVFAFSHAAPLLLKSVKTPFHWRLVFWGSLLLVLSVFTTLAIFRSQYLATHEVHISPFSFVIINFFFFIVSAILSFFVLPGWSEIKENLAHIKLSNTIRRNKKKAEKLCNEKEERKKILTEKNKQRGQLIHYAQYSVERVRKMYGESVEILKSTNIAFRTDRQVPDCFQEKTPELEINDPIAFYPTDNENDQ